MLNVELPYGLNGASLIQHSTFNTQHSTLKKAYFLAAIGG